ncbi:MAG: hypothetical protein IT437_01160 [Phycisphaerales bacterium]|nr:hypothetical protein [Phycisphaerales bacterium]
MAEPVPFDAPCNRCGYNLRGLDAAGLCPECGAGVADSLRGGQLRFASVEFVRLLARGARLVLWGMAIMCFGTISAVVLEGAAPSAPASTIVIEAVATGSTVMGLVGWWLLSAPDPAAELDRTRGSTSRVVLRGSLIVSLAAFGLTLLGRAVAVPAVPFRGVPTAVDMMSMLVMAGQVASGVAWIVHALAANFYVQHLARRLADTRLARRARAVLWTAAITLVLGIGSLLILLVPGGFLIMCAIPVLVLALLVMYIGMMIRLSSSLRHVLADMGGVQPY